MRKNLPLYIIVFVLLGGVLLLLYTAFRELTTYSELTNRNNIVHSNFQTLSRQINNAAVLHPELVKVSSSIKTRKLFFTDSLAILRQLELLQSSVQDPVNTKTVQKLDTLIRSELSWILRSNVPDSIIHHQSPEHIAAFQSIDSLLNQGIERTMFLIEYRKTQVYKKISVTRRWMILFTILSGLLLVYTTFNFFRQQTRTKSKEKELGIVLNRINDGVVSVDNDWHYTFLNDAALATHPLGKAGTLGKVIWDIHPEMKGTIFWDKYHEAMETGKVVEIEDYYAPMDTWFLVKVYPAADGLTIFFTDTTKSKKAEQKLSQTLKELTDYKFALDESSIVAVTDQEGIIKHANHNFCKISKYTADELIGQDHRIINSGYHPKEFIKNLWTTIASGKIWRGELKNKAKDETIYWVDATIVPFLDDKGNPSQYVAIQADITERKQVEDELASSEMHFRSLIENSTEGISLTDQFSNIIYRSPGSEKIMGILPTDNAIMLAHPEDLETIKNKYAELIKQPGITVDFQGRFLHGAGYYIWLEGTFTNQLDVKGVYAIVTNYRDISARKKAEEKLIASEKRFRLLIENNYDIISLMDDQFKVFYRSPSAVRITGWTDEEILHMDGTKNIHPDDREKAGIVVKELMANPGKTINTLFRNQHKDGHYLWVEGTVINLLKDEDVKAIVFNFRDVTERIKAEEKLATSEMHFRSLIEHSAEGIVLSDAFSNTIYQSPGAVKITGMLPKENTISLAHPEDLQTIKNKREEVMKKPGVPIAFQARFRHALGHYFWMEGSFTNLLHLEGVNAIVTNFRDITQRKEVEEKLIKSEKIYKTIASSIPGSVICLLDADYRYLLIEGDMLEKLGYSKKNLLGNKAEDVLPPERFKDVKEQLNRVLKGEVVISESSSRGYDIISRYIPLKDKDNIVYAIMTVAIDVTELKNAQRDITELNRGLEEKIIERTGQLKKSNDELEAFSYSVSHDLRAPLRGAIAFATILEEEYGDKLDDEAKRIITIIKNSTLKMGNLIDDLLAFSRMGKQGITKSLIDTKTMVSEIVAELAQQNKEHDSIKWEIGDLSPVHADVKMIRQVWINLLSNAIKYSGNQEQPLIEIGSYPEEGMAVFYIKDNGVGFDEEYKDKLFKVFQRLHDADKFEGTGVGLALVEKIVSRHDGKVWAEGKEDKGACFYFSLPL